MRLSKEKIFKNPPQYILFMVIESMKMFFWESTQIGFVNYPRWLTKIFTFIPFKDALRLLVSLTSIFAFIFVTGEVWRKKMELTNLEYKTEKNIHILFFILLLIFIFVGLHSFFHTLTRYSLPIAPLFLIVIAAAIQTLVKKYPSKV